MVRLKELSVPVLYWHPLLFQFQYGAIKRSRVAT